MDFRTPQLGDRQKIFNIVSKSGLLGSDLAFGNIFLLRYKYNLKICFADDFLLRHYDGPYGRKGFAFPIGEGSPEKVLGSLKEYALSKNMSFDFIFLSESQKKLLTELWPDSFRLRAETGDSDYIYCTEKLAEFRGAQYHKHKNHVNRFGREFPDVRALPLSASTWQDALKVAEKWLEEHGDTEENRTEYRTIAEALENISSLGLGGLILYDNGGPVAMTVYSEINDNLCDIHFEKAVAGCAKYGGYSVICKLAAERLLAYGYINREEDLGKAGLRQSKLSYRPSMIYHKYRAQFLG